MKLIMNKTKRNVMRKYIIYIASFVGSALLQTGCYDDKGDYDYHDVNTMAIVIPEMKERGSSGNFNYTRDFSDFGAK